jgi:hypothetical protein
VAAKRYFTASDPCGVTPSRLKRLGRATQLEYMEAWFRVNWENLANIKIHEDAEFVPIIPEDARSVLGDEFGQLVPDDCIQELVEKLEEEGLDWVCVARKQNGVETVSSSEGPAEPDPNTVDVSADRAPKTNDVPFFSGLVSDSALLPILGAPGVRRATALKANQSFFWPGVQNTPTATSTWTEPAAGQWQGMQDPPRAPPSDGNTGTSSQAKAH